ncbi:MAG: hypothetical protein C4555_07965 [Dehalococcoidia bacterium]|jgi:hypothetical protein|nr:MAG: hypothetical protein C4555_07965 [Dehalococcoidia bacterium]
MADQRKQLDKQCAAYLDANIYEFPLSVRVSHCFTRMGLESVRDLVRYSESVLLKERNFGRTSLSEVKQLLEKVGLRLGMSDDDICALESKPDKIEEVISSSGVTQDDPNRIYLTIPWFASVAYKLVLQYINNQYSSVAEALNVNPIVGYDSKIIDALKSIGFRFFGEIYDEVLKSLSDRQNDIVSNRLHSRHPKSLEELAQLFHITRERVRQLEEKAEHQFLHILTGITTKIQLKAINGLLGKIVLYETARGISNPLICSSAHPDQAFMALITFVGPFEINGDWILRNDTIDNVHQLIDKMRKESDRLGRISSETIDNTLDSFFQSKKERDKYLEDQLHFSNIDGEWFVRDSRQIRILLALDKIGRPATQEEIAIVAGLDDPSRINAQFHRYDFICRADKYRYAFIEWVDDPYDGIVGEIEQRIEEGGGIASVDNLLEEIPNRFNVSKTSIIAYLSTPMFVVIDGFVRLASQEELDAIWFGDPRDASNGVLLVDGSWAVRIHIEKRFIDRGYSAAIPCSIAAECGLRVGDSITVPVENSNHCVSLIWRLTTINRTVDLGRLSPILIELNIKPGDDIIVAPSRDLVRIYSVVDAPICTNKIGSAKDNFRNVDQILKDIFKK